MLDVWYRSTFYSPYILNLTTLVYMIFYRNYIYQSIFLRSLNISDELKSYVRLHENACSTIIKKCTLRYRGIYLGCFPSLNEEVEIIIFSYLKKNACCTVSRSFRNAYLHKNSHTLCFRKIHSFIENLVLDNLMNEKRCNELLTFINNIRTMSPTFHITLGDFIFRGIRDRIERAVLRRGENHREMSYTFKFECRKKTTNCVLSPQCNAGSCALVITGTSSFETNFFFTEIVFCPRHYKKAFKSNLLSDDIYLNALKLKRK